MDTTAPARVEEFVVGLRALAPLIAEHRAAIDTERRLPKPLFDALAAGGFFRMWLPAAMGGAELSPLDFMTVVEEAAALDGSVGWLVGNGSGMSRAAGYLPEDVSRTWFSEPGAFVTSATGAIGRAMPVAGGYRVTGRWPFGSGSHHASRFMGLCNDGAADGGSSPLVISCYFQPKDVTIIDNWHVSGLRGSDSCDFEVTDVFVPIEHTHPFVSQPATQPGLLYRMPNISVFGWSVSVVPLGIARGAMNCFADYAAQKTRPGNPAVLRDREMVQFEVGRADTQLRAARALLIEAMTQLMRANDAGGDPLIHARANLRAACAYAADNAVRIVDTLASTTGAVSIFEGFALERFVRDIHAAVKHVAMGSQHYILSGRLRLGLEPATPRF